MRLREERLIIALGQTNYAKGGGGGGGAAAGSKLIDLKSAFTAGGLLTPNSQF